MSHRKHLLPLYDQGGNLYAVMLSADFWTRYRHRLEPLAKRLLEEMEPMACPEPVHEWEELKAYWDFKYPYCADVSCGNCGAHTEDWQADPAHPFVLKTANFGGLAVFTCCHCGAQVRKKHFKDHVRFEFSTEGCGC